MHGQQAQQGLQGETHARATLDAWREQRADRLDPMRFHFIDAMARRAAAHHGEARRILDERLSALLDAYAADLDRENAACDADADADAVGNSLARARGPLGKLADYITASHSSAEVNSQLTTHAQQRVSSNPQRETLDYFRQTWSKLSADKQLRQSLEQVPGNAGPLNSSSLVHRSLSLMRELSPGYLQQFLSYVDALSWMEQMTGGIASPAKDAPRAASTKKSARSRSR
ncbi:DUF2894 domain-containing protein [Paraburkholderia sp. CNPSo 3157]|uniref:DUF2894 domain-containing protein n=1 Tax=Paraburkholderia franconis TaxID=2654983 RepID=A0A7X1NDY6_9BURK|nr:DUF2894 domain-containing protein [Paraburkholderia franconis]MPW20195.1 DUF2894 domain-containing protein [Paraburkholderia franconis]